MNICCPGSIDTSSALVRWVAGATILTEFVPGSGAKS